jgi:hypothetical protein
VNGGGGTSADNHNPNPSLDIIQTSVNGGGGTSADNHSPKPSDDIVISRSTGLGNAADYLTARLQRDHDDIFQRLAAGEFASVRQAAIRQPAPKPPNSRQGTW